MLIPGVAVAAAEATVILLGKINGRPRRQPAAVKALKKTATDGV
jgi:hypothetical protein